MAEILSFISKRTRHAFTRLELIACLAALALIIIIVVPALGTSAARNDRVACFSNLRQIGIAYMHFGLEHGGLPPWLVPMSEGGNSDYLPNSIPGLVSKNSSYVQFSVLSNSLDSPRYLADPGDLRSSLRPAQSWSGSARDGLYHISYQNNAISYFLGLHSTFHTPRGILAGDRNVIARRSVSGSCAGIEPVTLLSPDTGWTNNVHGLAGNLLFFDGSVEQTSTLELRGAVRNTIHSFNGETCALFPY